MSSTGTSVTEEFTKIINDFTNDLKTSYPELCENFESIDYDAFYNYCKNLYPENFFNILYENDDLFDNNETKYLLPNIDFSSIMRDETLGEQSKKTIWKYLQLILFCVCNNVNNKKDFGDANYLFEAINEDELHSKIQETMKEMKNIFFNSNNGDNSGDPLDEFASAFNDISNIESIFDEEGVSGENNMFSGLSGESGENIFENMMDPDKMKEHLSGIMNGKIGNLAKEIAEEATKELGLDGENMDEAKQHDFMKNLFKNPTKILSIVKNIGSKLEEKFKSGEMKESELLEEAQEIMGKMKDMPGLKNMMSSMGLNAGGKFDFKSMASKMQQTMRSAKMKERMQAKLQKNREKQQQESAPIGNLKEVEENTFVWNDDNSNPSQPFKKAASSASNKPKKSNKKKNKKKNKNKN